MTSLEKIVKNLPKSPGVYQFLNSDGKIIYIGKAKNIYSRVSSYFNLKNYDSFKTKVLSQQVANINHTVVDTESDALLLENSLIKKYQPKYNILLKDDKTFPWICVKKESFPRVFSTRKILKDGSQYYGPYTSVLMVNTLLGLIRQLYQIRTCSHNLSELNIESNKFKKCLEFHIGNCKAPCENLQTVLDYQITINQITEILKGNINEVIQFLKKLMKDFANNYKYEDAEIIRKKIELLEKYKSKSTIVNPKIDNIDVFSIIDTEKSAFINYLKVMNGAIVQTHSVELIKKLDEPATELLLFAILDIRSKLNSKSKEILVPFLPMEELPNTKYCVPKQGEKRKLLELSERNARHYMLQKKLQIDSKSFDSKKQNLLEKVKSDLHLKELPIYIECFDNSNTQGSNPVSSCVVFKNGKPSKKDYRHYNIKTVVGPNDFASMSEVVFRRYKRLVEEGMDLPQLIIVDGGKGQLNAALESLKELNLYGKIAILGIAKRLEELFLPNDPYPIYLDKNSITLKLIQNMRNEAHHFGVSFHRNKRSNEMLQSNLLNIKGIGIKSQEKLLIHFGSITNLKSQSILEIEKIVGKKMAKIVLEGLK